MTESVGQPTEELLGELVVIFLSVFVPICYDM